MMRTRPIRFTRFGTFYILFALGVGAAAINTGNNLLYLILGILLGFIVISGFLSDSGLWGIRTTWTPISALYAGEKATFECRAVKGWFPGIGVTIESRWSDGPPVLSFAPWIAARGSALLHATLIPLKRGVLELKSVHYSTHFPFGLFQKSHTWTMNDRWIVYPTLLKLSWDLLERSGELAADRTADRSGTGAVPFALRDYRPGDPLRQISWKASAKRQHLIVKEMEEEANDGDLFILESWPVNLNAQQTEHFISFIASVVFAAFQQGRPVGLALPERFFAPEVSRGHLRQILEFLALVEPGKTKAADLRTPSSFKGGLRQMDLHSLWRSYVART